MRKSPPKKQPGQGRGPRTMNGAAMDLRTAAGFLGGTEKQLRGLVERRLVPHRRLGVRIIFIKQQLEDWLASLPGTTVAEAQQNGADRYDQ